MISIQVPHFSNPLPNYFSMPEPAYSNGLPSYSARPQSHDSYPSSTTASTSTTASSTTTTNGTSPEHQQSQHQKPKSTLPGAKRRASRAGTRSVSTLTAAQLERKRANDREAQRAIRQRTKDHIESLERRIAELTSSSDVNAKLLQALQRNEELEQENAILRSRLNHAVAAMAEGGALNPDILTGPTSPSRRLKLSTQVRASSTPASAPRSVPTPTIPHSMPPQDQWNNAYSPISSTAERSPPLADVSPVSTNLRWGPAHPQVSPVVTEADRSIPPVEAGASIQQPHGVNYSYLVDGNGRPLPYSPAADASMVPTYPPPTASPPAHAYPAPHTAPQLTPTASSPAYQTFPGTPQAFMTGSTHENGPDMSMMPQRNPMDAPPLMYNMPPAIKADEH